jgi:hypothetical protein
VCGISAEAGVQSTPQAKSNVEGYFEDWSAGFFLTSDNGFADPDCAAIIRNTGGICAIDLAAESIPYV